MMTFWVVVAAGCAGVVAFLIVWMLGLLILDWLDARRGPGLQHGEYVDFVSHLGESQGIIRVPRDLAGVFTVPAGWVRADEVTSP